MRVTITTPLGDRYTISRWREGSQSAWPAKSTRIGTRGFLQRIAKTVMALGLLRDLLRQLGLAAHELDDHEVIEQVALRIERRELQVVGLRRVHAPVHYTASDEVPSQAGEKIAPKEEELHWIEIILVDEEGYPVVGVDYELGLSSGKTRHGTTDRGGKIRHELIPGGDCDFSYHQLDTAVWEPCEAAHDLDDRQPIRIERSWRRYGELYEVRQGDSVESIAARAGHIWMTIWEHEKNADIRKLRQSGHVLRRGDLIHVPNRVRRDEALAVDKVHTFKYKTIPTRLKVQFLEVDEPRAGELYELDIDGEIRSGSLDGNGALDEPISPVASLATITLKKTELTPEQQMVNELYEAAGLEPTHTAGELLETYELPLRHLDPTGEVSGVQARLRNYGFDIGDITGELNERTRDAIYTFQEEQGLPSTGRLDDPTRNKLHAITAD